MLVLTGAADSICHHGWRKWSWSWTLENQKTDQKSWSRERVCLHLSNKLLDFLIPYFVINFLLYLYMVKVSNVYVIFSCFWKDILVTIISEMRIIPITFDSLISLWFCSISIADIFIIYLMQSLIIEFFIFYFYFSRNYRNGTSMISLIIPPKDQVSRVQKMLADEYGTASNIKSRTNRLLSSNWKW